MRLLIVVLLLGPLTTVGFARDLYVSNVDGDDRRDGSQLLQGPTGGPCRSIRRALELAGNGDRIILAKTDEPYRESITLQAGRHSGLDNRPFVIVGNGAILDGTQKIADRAWEHAGGNMYRFRPSRLSHHLLYLDNRPAKRIILEPFTKPELKAREWCTYDNHIYFGVEPDRVPSDYNLTVTTLPVGLTLFEVRNVVVRDLVVQGFQLDGVNAHDDARDVTLISLNCRGNGRSGISIGGSSKVMINACLVGNNGAAQVRTEGVSQTQIIDSDLLENTAPALVKDGGYVTFIPNSVNSR